MTAKHIQKAGGKLRQVRDELAAQVEVMREALENSQKWHQYDKWRDDGDESNYDAWQVQANRIDEAIALPNTAADILRQRDARVIRQFAAILLQSRPPLILPFAERYAKELERKNG